MTQSLFNRLTSRLRKLSKQTASPRRRSRRRQASEPLESRHMLSAVVSLVGDSITAPAGLPFTTEFVEVDGTMFFTANTVTHGLELWKSDGTTEGTVRVSDIQAGPASSEIKYLTNVNGTLFFSADDGVHGQELWKSDGTRLGTVMVSDLQPGPFGTGPRELTSANGKLYFSGRAVSTSQVVFESDGTSAGTRVVADFGEGFFVNGLTSVGGDPWFIVHRFGDSQISDQIWTIDGTETEAFPITHFPELESVRIYSPITNDGGRQFFYASDQEHGTQLWTIDGVGGAEHIFMESAPGPASSDYYRILGVVGEDTYFSSFNNLSGWSLWRKNGPSTNATLLGNIPADSFAQFNGDVYVAGNGKLWKVNGDELTAVPVNLDGTSPFVSNVFESDGKLLVTAHFYAERGLWIADATSETLQFTRLLNSRLESFLSGTVFTVGSTLMFVTNDGIHGAELWKSDGTVSGTALLKDIIIGSADASPHSFVNLNGDLFFITDERFPSFYAPDSPSTPQSLWMSLKGIGGTVRIPGNYAAISTMVKANDALFMFGENGGFTNVWTGNQFGIRLVNENTSARVSLGGAPTLATVGDAVYYMIQSPASADVRGLWKTDGTPDGTSLVHSFESTAQIFDSVSIGNSLYYFADDGVHGYELWKSDGTHFGTFRLSDLTENSFPVSTLITVAGTKVYFRNGNHIGVSDGTVEGSKILTDLSTQLNLTAPKEFASIGDTLFMTIYSPETGYELYKTNGTAETTSLVKDIRLGNADSRPRNLTNLNGKLLFLADEPAGRSLWKSDGTPEGTQRLHQFGPVSNPEAGQNWSVVDDKVMFTVLDPTTGLRHIWVSDGTVEGTLEIPTHLDETLVIDPATTFTKYGDGIAFAAATESVGSELFRIDTTVTMMPPASMELNKSAQRTDVSWGDVPGAIQYDVWMQNLTNPSAPIIRKRVNDPKLTLVDSSGINIAGDLETSAYRMWVRSLPVVGEPSAWSAPKEIVLGPTPLIHSMVTSSTNRTPTFQWAGSAGTVSYELWVDNNDAKTRPIFQQGLTRTSFAVTTPLDPARYSAWVRGTRADGTKTNWSPVSNFTIFAAPIVLTSGGGESLSGQPSLAWAAVPGATGYDVQITAAGSNSILYRANNVQGTAHTLKNGLASGQYKVYVRAIKGSQPLSIWGSGNDLQVKLPPTGLVRTGSAIAGNVGVAWNAVPLAVSYTIELINTFTGIKVQADQTQTSTTLNPSPALPAGQYAARVRSNFATGAASNWSPVFAFDALRSAAVTITSSSAATADATPTITWTASPGATGYEIFVSRLGSSAAVYTRSGITTTSHRVDVPLTSTVHRIWVRPTFADGSRGIWGPGQQIQIGPAPVITRTTTGFSWTAINAATHYEFWLSSVDPTAGVKRVLYDAKLVTMSYTLPTNFPKGRYQLWVRAIRSEAGASYLGNWGTTETFDLT